MLPRAIKKTTGKKKMDKDIYYEAYGCFYSVTNKGWQVKSSFAEYIQFLADWCAENRNPGIFLCLLIRIF